MVLKKKLPAKYHSPAGRRHLKRKKKKDKGLIEDLKKGKDIKPFYVIPKNKKNKKSLLIKADKKTANKLLELLNSRKSKKYDPDNLVANQALAALLKNNNPGKKVTNITIKITRIPASAPALLVFFDIVILSSI